MAGVGSACLVVALLAAGWAATASIYGVRAGRSEFVVSGRRAIYCMAAVLTVAMALLEAAFLRSDFSYGVVAEASSTDTPTFYKVTAMWATALAKSSNIAWLTACSRGAKNARPNHGSSPTWVS